MDLQPGASLAHYRLSGKIGAGGMGEVWKAVDTTLDREVAIKVLPAAFSDDPDRLARFEREAKVLASLNHAHIAAIYGLHETDGVRFLAMEYVPGEDLAARIERGPVPLDEALAIAESVAVGLEAAHARGVVHRDLKPANIRLDGPRVKILDFGLAKAFEAAGSGGDVTQSPTLTMAATRDGIIMGTAAYMSPEQARGQAADRRADVWAFGVVLFEMLTGRRLFQGATISDVLAAVLRAEPEWNELPAATPAAARRLLRRCLARVPEERLRDMGDVALEIREALSQKADEAETVATAPPPRRAGWSIAITALAAALGTFLVSLALRDQPAPAPLRSLTIPDAGFHAGSTVAISPDGSRIAHSPAEEVGRGPLTIRDLDGYGTREVSGEIGSANPFFSPDGAWVAYAAPEAIYRVALAGGVPQLVVPGSGWDVTGAWAPGDILVLSRARFEGRAYNGLIAVPAAGGEPRRITTTNEEERIHRWPHVLPDGRGILFTVNSPGGYHVAYATLDGKGPHRQILDDASMAQFVPRTGHLLFYRPSSENVLAVAFDADAAEVRGDPVTAMSGVLRNTQGGGSFAIAGDGTLIYTSSTESDPMSGSYGVSWVEREGRTSEVLDEPGSWAQPRVSPDGRRLLRKTATPNCDLWTYDLERRALSRVTFEGDNHDPVWHPSGRKITFGSQDAGQRQIVSRAADGTGEDTVLSAGDFARSPTSWSADGRLLAFVEDNDRTGLDIWVLDTETGEERPFLNSAFAEDVPALSPDGRFVAYASDESGRREVYVRPYPGPGGRVQISNDGGMDPVWRRNGRELFYSQGRQMMGVEINPEEGLRASTPRKLFEGPFIWQRPGNHDLTPDGARFVMIKGDAVLERTDLRVVLNWLQELERLAPRSR